MNHLTKAEALKLLGSIPLAMSEAVNDPVLFAGLTKLMLVAEGEMLGGDVMATPQIGKRRYSFQANVSNKIPAIKFARERMGWGLKEAKDYIDEAAQKTSNLSGDFEFVLDLDMGDKEVYDVLQNTTLRRTFP